MILKKTGDLLSAKGIIVHGCNAQGVMGSGVALAIRRKFPGAYNVYRHAYETQGLRLGSYTFWVEDDVTIINGVTQEFYGRDSKQYVDYEAVRQVFNSVAEIQHIVGGPVNFPLIGCGLGGGDWTIVSKIIENTQHPNTELILWVQE